LRTSIARRGSGDNAAIGKCDAPGVHEMGPIARAIAINRQRVAELEIAALEPAA